MTAEVTVVGTRPGMGGATLHLLSDERFSIWERRRPRRRAERFEVIEAGASARGMARTRGHAPTLEAALELVATLTPSTPAEILAMIRTDPETSAWERQQVDKLARLATPGTRLWVLPGHRESGPGYAVTSEGLHCDRVVSLIDDASALECWSVRWRGDDGRESHGRHVVLLEDARRAWWIVRDGRTVAGGPPIYDAARAAELAVEFGGHVQMGLGADDPAVVARHESVAGPGQACACGCGRQVAVARSGPPRRYATDACRAAVSRRRRAEVPLDLPRQPNRHGRRGLAATQRT